MFKSVFAKYITTFMTIIFVSFLILVLIMTGTIRNYAGTTREQMLKSTAQGAAEFLGSHTGKNMGTNNFKNTIITSQFEVDNMLHSLASDEDVSILLVDNNGNVIRMISGGEIVASEAIVPRNIMDEVNNLVELSEFEELEGVFETPQMFCTAPVFSKDGYVCGTVFACSSTAVQDELLGVTVKTIVISSLWIMLAALIAVYIVTERVTQPLREMSRMAKEFANGNFTARARVRGNDEVSALALAFNDMADSITRLEVMRNSFVANVSHDLRTPMTTISGFIDNILSGAIPKEKHAYYLEMIRTEVARLARLVSSLLDISRIQAGERKFEFKSFDACEMARRILISFESKIEAKHLDVSFECDRERMTVCADYDAIYQILYNIIDNGVKFSREGGALRVSLAEQSDHRVCVSVYNEGEGIAAEDVPFIFERFYKGDKSRGLDKSGLGLGMFISKTIIDAHKEKIWVRSEQGHFCEFNFTLRLTE